MSRLDYHDPTAGIAGAPPASSALTLRLILALFGLSGCAALAALTADLGGPKSLIGMAAALALIAAIDVVVVLRRKLAGEPG